MEYEPAQAVRARRSLPTLLIAPLLAFVAGVATMGWLLVRWSAAAQFLGIVPQPAPAPPPQQPVVTVERVPVPAAGDALTPAQRPATDPEIIRRVNLMEQRLAQLDIQSRSAAGNADRAEALLVAFAARRAVDRGVSLGYLESMLRQRFGASQPAAVGTVIAQAREPVTLQQLQDELVELAPKLSGGGPDQGWWDSFRAELAWMVIVR
jgi:hypothetical protein